MGKIFEETDLYEDIKGACINTLMGSIKIGLTYHQSILRFQEDMEGIFEENELERVLTLISIGVFAIKNNCFDSKIAKEVKYAINEIENNSYNNLLHNDDMDQIQKDMITIKQYLK